jgi:hypothetical protein
MRKYLTGFAIGIAISAVVPTSAAASTEDQLPEWFPVVTTDTGTIITARSEDLIKGRSNQTAARNDKTISFMEARSLYAINCVARTSVHAMSVFYFRNGRIETTDREPEQFIVPESNLDLVADLLCFDPAPEPDYR